MIPSVTIIDYGLGNIFSVHRVFSWIGCKVKIAKHKSQIKNADFLVLPGVGAFQKGMQELSQLGLVEPIREFVTTGKPCLGICLGMQLFFENSEENGNTKGLDLLPGKVVRIIPKDATIKIPHIGWSPLNIYTTASSLTSELKSKIEGHFAYFVHSYHPLPRVEHLVATTTYHNYIINALVKKDNLIGCQFHPEKSGENFFPFLRHLIEKCD